MSEEQNEVLEQQRYLLERRMYRLDPAPPKLPAQEYIVRYLTEKEEKYLAWYLHDQEPALNKLAQTACERYAMWTDFDAEKGTLTVRRTLHNKEGGGYYVGETKTGAGRRIIKLPPSTAQLLSERKRTSISQWIFPSLIHPEDPIMPNSGYTRMKKLLAEAGLPDMRFHDLRHTFATHALTSGVDAKTLSGILGHTKTSFTLDTYTHVTGDMHRKASGIVGEFMSDFVVKG